MDKRHDCKAGSQPMTNADWLVTYCPDECYWYPGRDCPGWTPGGICSRIGSKIPLDAVKDARIGRLPSVG